MARAKLKHNSPPETADREAVVVLGMHRSGTSALCGALDLMGVDFGQRLFGHDKDNEKGYWEHPEIAALHDELLRSLGSRWDDDKPLPSDWVTREITRDVTSGLLGILERDFAHSPLFGLKDPRMCRLVPLWFSIFQTLRVEPHFVLVVRHPWEVAESLAQRDGMEHPKAYLLWLEHLVQAERATLSYERAFVRYEDMVNDPVALLDKLRQQLGVNLGAPSEGESSLRDFLDPSLRHHQFNNEEADKLRHPVPQIAMDFYETLRSASTSREIGRKMEPLVAQFIRGRELFRPRIDVVEAQLGTLLEETVEAWRDVASFKTLSDRLQDAKELPGNARENTSRPKTTRSPNKGKRMVRATALLATHDLVEEAVPWLAEARNIFDELVIFIDGKRVTPGTVARAEKVGARVHYHKPEKRHEWDLAAMARACGSDWVFIIERDEQLSPEWQQGRWRQILETTQCTHFWVPRRWVVPDRRYITADPWWPDFQLRLVRNYVPGTVFPTRRHNPIYIPGPGGSLRDLAIHHHALWLYSRTAREDIERYYDQLRLGSALGHHYLYEDFDPPQGPLPKPVRLDANREISGMEKLSPETVSKISLEVSAVPREVRVSAVFWLDAKVTNRTNETLYAAAPFPVRPAYHWIEKTTRQMVVFEGKRSGLFPRLEANSTARYPMTIFAPSQPGEYILQTTMVQDGVCWFDDIRPGIVQEFAVSVTA